MLKQRKRILSLALMTAICLPAASIAAEGENDNKWYAGAGLGVSRLEPDRNGTIYSVADKSSAGFKLYLGYDWSEKVSIEGYYSDLGEAEMSPHGEVSYKDLGASGLYYFYQQHDERHKGWEAFLKAGLGWMKNDSELPYERVHNIHVMFGLGGGYTFDNGFTVRADIDLYDEDSQFLILSVAKRFGE
ncbi:MAG: porin family protein [Candidatus Thiodiazotropha sp. (ex Monitilora ramsayi)]|nr:porin family protein [Candidatus Thiodiazotropha sp. (ex Monitilora ramsayi)]